MSNIMIELQRMSNTAHYREQHKLYKKQTNRKRIAHLKKSSKHYVITNKYILSKFSLPLSQFSLACHVSVSLRAFYCFFFLPVCSVSGFYSCRVSTSHRTSPCAVGLFTGPFGPRLPSRLCLCQNPAAFHWLLAALGSRTGREKGREREEM